MRHGKLVEEGMKSRMDRSSDSNSFVQWMLSALRVEERVEIICLTDDSMMLCASSISATYPPTGSLPS